MTPAEEIAALARMPPGELTMALERVGDEGPPASVLAAIVGYLAHERAVVREGAALGLRTHLDTTLRELLREVAETDPSPGVRAAIKDVVE